MKTPHPNEIRNAQERQRLFTKWFGNAQPRMEDEDKGGNWTPDRVEASEDWYKAKERRYDRVS